MNNKLKSTDHINPVPWWVRHYASLVNAFLFGAGIGIGGIIARAARTGDIKNIVDAGLIAVACLLGAILNIFLFRYLSREVDEIRQLIRDYKNIL